MRLKGTAAGELRDILRAVGGEAGGEEQLDYAMVEKSAELRYTLGPIYAPNALDAHGEYAEEAELRKALWDFSLNGDRRLRKQHSREHVGDIVELVQWPFEQGVELTAPGGDVKKATLPAGTTYAGVLWTPAAWPLVKNREITGYSMGGAAVRIHDAGADKELLKFT